MHVLEKHSTSIGQGNYLARVIVESSCTEPPPEFGSNLCYPAVPFHGTETNALFFLFLILTSQPCRSRLLRGGSRTKGLPWAYDGPELVH